MQHDQWGTALSPIARSRSVAWTAARAATLGLWGRAGWELATREVPPPAGCRDDEHGALARPGWLPTLDLLRLYETICHELVRGQKHTLATWARSTARISTDWMNAGEVTTRGWSERTCHLARWWRCFHSHGRLRVVRKGGDNAVVELDESPFVGSEAGRAVVEACVAAWLSDIDDPDDRPLSPETRLIKNRLRIRIARLRSRAAG